MSSGPLPPARARALEALIDLTRDGWPTTNREVARRIGVASPSTAYTHLLLLERAGLARRHPRRSQGGWLPASDR